MSDRPKAGEPKARRAVEKIAFVGQPEYFRCMYENDLDRDYDVREFVLGWGKGLNHYLPLIKFDPDAAFFFRPECYPPSLLEALSGIKVALSSEPIPKHVMGHGLSSADMWYRFESLCGAKQRFDFFFHYDKSSIRFLLEQGFRVDGEFLFPVATGLYQPAACEKTWDWGFFGRDTPHRDRYLGLAKRDYRGLHVVHGIFGQEFVRLMNSCTIGLNIHVDPCLSLEHRMHNMMACGVMVMSEPLSHNEFLKPGVHYVEFSEPAEFFKKLAYYLDHDDRREKIAANGLRLIREELSAEKSFRRLIEHVALKKRPLRLFSNYQPQENCQAGKHAPFSFVRLNAILAAGPPPVQGWLGRWRQGVERALPPGTIRRTVYSRTLGWVKRALGDEFQPLGEHLKRRFGKNRPDEDPNEPIVGKASLRAVLRKSASRLGLPRNAPSLLIVLPSQSISGGTMVLCEHANRLIRRGYNVVLIDNLLAGEDRFHLDWFPDQQAAVVPINRLNFDCFVSAAVATHWTTAPTVIDLPADRHLYFVQSNEIRFNPAGSVAATLARQTYSMDFEFVVIARWLADWLTKDFGKTAQYVPNAVDEKRFYPDEPLSPKGPKLRVLLEGAISAPLKGMDAAFRAVRKLDCEVWCVSSDGQPKLGWRCDRFFHRVPQAEMRQIYSSCDVLLKMSRVEGFFLPPLEMMACGGTVVTGKVTGYDEYIVDGHNGLVVEQGDIAAARRCIQRLIDDRRLLEQLKAHGRETAAQWRWDRASETFCRILDSNAPSPPQDGRSPAGPSRAEAAPDAGTRALATAAGRNGKAGGTPHQA
ncbi:MAG: glycosyltransferase [Thermoguttaceae bacterium]|jgi:glycosyltransferase involved in cell wall biosynthesis